MVFMRKAHLIVSILCLLCNSIFGSSNQNTDSLPPLNGVVRNFVQTTIGKKIGRGECWDLANAAMSKAGATWNHQFIFGKLVDPNSAILYPGDIIQFYGVKLKYQKNGQTIIETMKQHTAIVYRVIAPGIFEIAQQNTGGRSGKKVSLSEFDLKTISKGYIKCYRPEK
jgi:hypothetical protein